MDNAEKTHISKDGDPGIPPRTETEVPGAHDANQKKAEENTSHLKEWDRRLGNKTEVLDDEGHRNTINHY